MNDTAIIITMHVAFLLIGACVGKWSSAVEVAHWKRKYEALLAHVERSGYLTPRADSDPIHTPPSAAPGAFVQYEHGKSDVGPKDTGPR